VMHEDGRNLRALVAGLALVPLPPTRSVQTDRLVGVLRSTDGHPLLGFRRRTE
jgi:hypothetical protein